MIRSPGQVTVTAFHPSGKSVLTGTFDGRAYLWSAVDGRQLGGPMEHRGVVTKAAFSPDGKVLVTASSDSKELRADINWIMPRLTIPAPAAPDSAPPVPASPVPSSKVPVPASPPSQSPERPPSGSPLPPARPASTQHYIQFWNVDDGMPTGREIRLEGQIHALCISPDGQTLITGSGDGMARFWGVTDGSEVRPPLRHGSEVLCVAFSPDGTTVLTGSRDGKARLWSAISGAPVAEPMTHSFAVRTAAFSPDGKTAFTLAGETKVRLWNTSDGKAVGRPLEHMGVVNAAAFSPDGRTLLTGCSEAVVQAPSGPPMAPSKVLSPPDAGFGLRPIVKEGNCARLWSIPDGQRIGAPMFHQRSVLAVAYSPDGQTVITGSADQSARLWNGTDGRPIGPPIKHPDQVGGVEFSPDGQTILTSVISGLPFPRLAREVPGSDTESTLTEIAAVWAAPDAVSIRAVFGQPLEHPGGILWLDCDADRRIVITAGRDGSVRRWNAKDGALAGQPIEKVGYGFKRSSADGKFVVTCDWDGTVRLWNAENGTSVGRVMKHDGGVTGVEFSPEGKTLITAGREGTARLWSAEAGTPIGQPMRLPSTVTAISFSPDGKTLLAGSADGTAQRWSAEHGTPIGQPLKLEGAVRLALLLRPDGKTLLTNCEGKTTFWSAADGKPIGPLTSNPASQPGGTPPVRRRQVLPSAQGPPIQVGLFRYAPGARSLARGWETPSEGDSKVLNVSLDGRTVLIANGRSAQLWRSSDGIPMGGPMEHQGEVTAGSFSPDGETVMTACTDGEARLWSAAAGASHWPADEAHPVDHESRFQPGRSDRAHRQRGRDGPALERDQRKADRLAHEACRPC